MFTDPLSFEPSSGNCLCSIQLPFSVPHFPYLKVTPGGSVVKNLPDNAGDTGDLSLIHGSARSPEAGNGKPLQVFLLGESYGQKSLVGYSPWGHKESDMT